MSSKDLPKDKLEPENPFRLLYSDYGKSTDHIDQSDTTSTSLRRSAQIRLRDSGLSDESIRAGDSLRVSAFPNVPEKEPKTSGQNLPDNNSALLGDANYSAKGIPVPYQPPDIPNNRIVFSAPIDRVELPDHPRLDARLPDQPRITTEFLDDRTATGTKGIPIPYVPPDNPPTRIVMSVPISRADLPEQSSTSPILKIEIPEFRNGNTKPVNDPITDQKPGNDQKPIIGQQPSNDQRPVISQQPINDQRPVISQQPINDRRPVVSQLPVSDLRPITGLKPPTDLNQIADPKPTVDNGNSRIIAGSPVKSVDIASGTSAKGIPFPYIPPEVPSTRIVTSAPIGKIDSPERIVSNIPIGKIDSPERIVTNTPIGRTDSPERIVSNTQIGKIDSSAPVTGRTSDQKPIFDSGNSRIVAGSPVTSVDIASGTSAKGIPFPYIPPELPKTRIVTSAPIGKIDSPERIVNNTPIGKIDSPERIVTNTPISRTDSPERIVTSAPIGKIDSPERIVNNIPIGKIDSPERIVSNIPIGRTDSPERIVSNIPIGRTDSPERIVTNIPIGKIDSSAPVTGRTSDQKPIFDSGNSRIVANTPVTNSEIARDTSSAKGIPFPYVPPENPPTRIVTSVPVGRIDSPELRTNLQIARVDIPESRLTFPIVRFGVTDSPATASPIARVGIPDSLANTPIARFDLPISRPIIKSDTNSDLGKSSSKGFPVPYVPPENPLTRIVTSAPIGRIDSPSLPISRVTIPDFHAPESHTIAPVTRANAPNARIDFPTFRAGDSSPRFQLKFDVEPRLTKAISDVLGPRFVPTYTPKKFGFPLQAKSVSEYLGPRFLPVTVNGRADNQTPAFKATPEVISSRNILSTKSLLDVVPARILPTAKPIPEANPALVVAKSKSTAEVIPSHITKTSKSAPEAVPPHVIPTPKLTPKVVTARTSLPSKSAPEITAAHTAPTPKSTHEAIPARIIATSKSAPEVIPTRTALPSKPTHEITPSRIATTTKSTPEATPSRIATTTKSTPEATPSRIASTTKSTPEATPSRIASTTKSTPEATPSRIASTTTKSTPEVPARTALPLKSVPDVIPDRIVATNKSIREIIPAHVALPPIFSKLPFKAAVAAGFKTSEKAFIPKTPILNAALTAWKEEEKRLAEKPKVHLKPAESEVFQLEKPVSEGSDEDKSEFPEDSLLAGALLLGSAAKAKNNSKLSSEEDSNGNENTSACQPLIRPTHLISSQDCLVNIAESKYGDRAIAFLIVELNAGSLKQTDLGDRLVIELSERQQIELPVSLDIENFYNRNAKNSKTIVTIVNQSNVTKELLDTYFGAFVS
jgi:hypothetical protein